MRMLTRLVAATALVTVMASEGPAQPPSGTQLLFLGTAGGPPLRKERSEPATLLIVDGRRYLIDCGIGTVGRLIESDVRSETIGTIFLTHLHPDHDLGLADVLANDFQQGDAVAPDHSINIYGPPLTKALVEAAYRYISIPYTVFRAESLGPSGGVPATSPFEAHEITDGVVFQDDKIKVIASENTHYAVMPQTSRATMKSYAYRFETPHGVVVFTGDTGPSDDVVRLADGADALVAEVSDFAAMNAFVERMGRQYQWTPERRDQFKAHMTQEHLDIKDVGEMAARAHVRSVLLYHWMPTDPSAYVTGVKKYFTGPVFGTADLQRYCLDASPNRPPLHPCE